MKPGFLFQVMLFFYMIILFLIFIIQFSVACACLAVDEKKEIRLAETVNISFPIVLEAFKIFV